MSFLEDHTTRGNMPCPWCHERNDVALNLHDEPRVPEPGNVGICFSCTMPMVWQEVGPPRVPTESEWMALNEDDNITLVRREVFMSKASVGEINYIDKGTTVENDG